MKYLVIGSILFLAMFITTDSLYAQDHSVISWEKPEFLIFGSKIDVIKTTLLEQGFEITERSITPIELPTAKESQIQLDVEGIVFGGIERFAELIFADGIFDMMWILTEAEEEEIIKTHLRNEYGDPSHSVPGAWFYIDHKTALRNEPHEVLFISDRLKEPYRMWLESMSED